MSTVAPERLEVRAVAKWVRISPRKARLVVDHIRGRTVPEARTVLAVTTRTTAREIEKVLRSAVANAEANHGLVGDRLMVSAAHVDDGLIIKRWKPRARGRVARIKKRTCHITIKLAPVDGVSAAAAARPTVEEREAPVRETESAGAPTPEEQAAATAVVAEPEADVEPEADAATEPEPEPEPEAEATEPEPEKPKRRRIRRSKKDEEE